jgi:hypothetical protein
MRIEIVIDELVLTGVDPRDRHRIADALQAELMRLARADPLRWRQAAAAEVRAADCVVPARGGRILPDTMGAQLAGAIAGVLVASDASRSTAAASTGAPPAPSAASGALRGSGAQPSMTGGGPPGAPRGTP